MSTPTADEIAEYGRYAIECLERALDGALDTVSGDEVLTEIEHAWMAFRLHCGSPEPMKLDPADVIEYIEDEREGTP